MTFVDSCKRSEQTSPEIPRHMLEDQDCAWPVLSHSHSAVDPITAIAWWRCLSRPLLHLSLREMLVLDKPDHFLSVFVRWPVAWLSNTI